MKNIQVRSGINIQFPISQLILSGQKSIETRTYPIPKHYIDEELFFVETPGRQGKFKTRIVGIIIFGPSRRYKSKSEFYRESHLHKITPNSPWKWEDKPKWAWPIKSIRVFGKIQPIRGKIGICFTKRLEIRLRG